MSDRSAARVREREWEVARVAWQQTWQLLDQGWEPFAVIGRGGEKLKTMSSDARRDMEQLFGGPVYLETWVKVKSGWADDERALKSLGYE